MSDDSSAPLDRQVLETLQRRAQAHPLVSNAAFERTSATIRSLIVTFDTDQYPESVASASLTVRWFENDDYSFHYRERRPGASPTLWQCRWDRHPNPHAARAHFHEPPHADDSAVVDDSVGEVHPSEMLSRTLANIRERIQTLWDR